MRGLAIAAFLAGLSMSCTQQVPTGVGDRGGLSPQAFVSTFTVVNTDDAGPGSLRQALLDANASPGEDLIRFAIPGAGPHTIQPLSPLPIVSDPVTIDGYTQPGASPNTNGPRQGTNAVLKIVLNGDAGDARMTIDASGTVIRGLVVNGALAQLHIRQGSDSVISGCFIGTDPTGTIRTGVTGRVVTVQGSSNLVGGPTPADRNLISGVNGEAVFLLGTNNVLENNLIGLDATGTVVLGNAGGIAVGGTGLLVGGSSYDLGNVITGNNGHPNAVGGAGVTVNRSDDITVSGNLIGTDVSGTVALGSQRRGVQVLDATNVRVGEPNGVGNVISSNNDAGVLAQGVVSGLRVSNNLIGVDITGQNLTSPATTNLGIFIGAGIDNLIQGNTIAGTASAAILLGSNTRSVVTGNRLGTNASGTAALGIQSGINVASPDNQIGGPGPGDGNVIGGATGLGILVQTTQNVIQGNSIGVDPGGSIPLPNGGGITLAFNSPGGNLVGGSGPGEGNHIAFNRGGGVGVACCGTGNTISGNSIHSNGGLGIGHSPGGNNDQPFPTLATAGTADGAVLIQGTLNSAPSSSHTIEFFSNAVPDPSGFGEGETFLGDLEVTTDAAGFAPFFAVLGAAVPAGHYASATATGPDGSTSEFSAVLAFEAATPEEKLGVLVDRVQDLLTDGSLTSGQANGMLAILQSVGDRLDSGNTSAAIRQLEAFVRLVEAAVAQGELTVEEGGLLIDLAEATIRELEG